MAIKKTIKNTSLKLALDNGIVDGKVKVKNKTYKNVRANIEDESLYLAGKALGNLNERDLFSISKLEESELSQD